MVEQSPLAEMLHKAKETYKAKIKPSPKAIEALVNKAVDGTGECP